MGKGGGEVINIIRQLGEFLGSISNSASSGTNDHWGRNEGYSGEFEQIRKVIFLELNVFYDKQRLHRHP